jgi:hypothetical protein
MIAVIVWQKKAYLIMTDFMTIQYLAYLNAKELHDSYDKKSLEMIHKWLLPENEVPLTIL